MFNKKQYQKGYHESYDSIYYQKNKERLTIQKKLYRIQLRDWYNNLKQGLKCKLCGENDPRCIDFHHIDPKLKTMNCADFLNMSCKTRLLKEIEKCEALCANCHRKMTRKL
jgi:hypothetical protein